MARVKLKLYPENIYHIYNRGNNKQKIFFSRDNYIFFLKKVRDYLKPYIEFMCYCLMPNHFHFLVFTPKDFNSEKFSNSFKVLLSSYTKAINVQEQRTGSLFQQNSKAKCLTIGTAKSTDYPLICFNYIHKNPLSSGLVNKIEDWEFSSFRDYIGEREGTLCNKSLTLELLDLSVDIKAFYEFSYSMVYTDELDTIF